jgi:hypothetical protein
MNKQLDKNKLGYLGVDFQYKLLKIFIEEQKFFEDVASIVDQNAFSDALLRMFVGTIKDYFIKNGVVPSYEFLGILLNEKAKTETDKEEYSALIHKLRFEVSYEGYDTVKEMAPNKLLYKMI